MSRSESVRQQLERLSVRPTKQRGQNFLSNPEILRGIVRFGEVHTTDRIVEIGPGLGALTRELVAAGSLAAVVEIEPSFCQELRVTFPDVVVCEADARSFDFATLGRDIVVFGNVPYSVSTDILFNLIAHARTIRRAVLLLQREFVERMAAPPGSRTYGILSVMVQLWADVQKGSVIGGGSFHPPTKVESRLVRLDFLQNPRYPLSDLDLFRRVVRASFSQRRRMIGNSLKTLGLDTTEIVRPALERAGIDPRERAEQVSIERFVRLTEEIQKAVPTRGVRSAEQKRGEP